MRCWWWTAEANASTIDRADESFWLRLISDHGRLQGQERRMPCAWRTAVAPRTSGRAIEARATGAPGTQPRRGTDGTYGFGGTPEYFTDGSLGELGTAACGYAAGPPPPPTPPPPPPTPPPPPPPPPAPTPGEQQPCTTYPEFMAYSQEVTAACCDDASAPCVAGLPTACGEACANANLLPRLPWPGGDRATKPRTAASWAGAPPKRTEAFNFSGAPRKICPRESIALCNSAPKNRSS